jgi:glycosyltransferase involved in cell wall biosynthesis
MAKRLKVLHLITNSGQYENFSLIAEHTDYSQFELTVASLEPAGRLQTDLLGTPLSTHSFNAYRRDYPKTVFNVASYLRKNRIDILQTHLFDASIVGLIAAKMAKTPISIFTGHHSHEIPLHGNRLPLFADNLSSRFLSDYIIAPSAHMKGIFEKSAKVPSGKIAVVHHGFDLSYWNPEQADGSRIKSEFNLQGRTVIGAVGRLYWIKKYDLLLRAFAKASERFSDVSLLIVGDGIDRLKLQREARELGIAEKVVFTGLRSDRLELYSSMDFFVHPSLEESFGMVIIEALAMGKPVISTKVGISPDIIKSSVNGLLIERDSEEELRDALFTMLELKGRWKEMSSSARRSAQPFAAENMVRGYEENYKRWFLERTRSARGYKFQEAG